MNHTADKEHEQNDKNKTDKRPEKGLFVAQGSPADTTQGLAIAHAWALQWPLVLVVHREWILHRRPLVETAAGAVAGYVVDVAVLEAFAGSLA